MKVKFFVGTDVDKLEKKINEWLSKEGIGPSDIFRVCQTEDDSGWTISIWYLH